MNLKEAYEQIGDYDDALARLMREELVKRFAIKFMEDRSYKELKDAIENGDNELAFRAAHTLKGTSANVSLTKLHDAASKLTEQLRSKNEAADPELVAEVDKYYNQAIDILSKIE